MINKLMRFALLRSRNVRYGFDQWTYNKYYKNGGELESFENIYSEQPMLVVGNGPSLNKTPLDLFAKYNSIGLNKINLIFPKTSWRPKFICCANNIVAWQNREFFTSSNIPIFLSWKARMFTKSRNKNKIKYFLNLPTTEFSCRFIDGVGSSGTVTYTALQLAYFFGANPIILVGVDHNFGHTGQANTIATMNKPDENHFHPEYFKKGQKWGLPNLPASEIGYKNALKAYTLEKRKIYDATVGGKLQVFPKIEIDYALKLFASSHNEIHKNV